MEDNKLYFANDDEFINFVLSSVPEMTLNTKVDKYVYDYPFTQNYYDALDRGCVFVITDPLSKVLKRGCVYRGLITKKVDNLHYDD